MKERTTNLNKLRKGTPFTWGELVKLHDFDIYTIGEYHPHVFEGCSGTNKIDYGTTDYHIWINDKNASCSFGSLEEAIVNAIAIHHDGLNTQAGYFFMKMIKNYEEVER